MDHKYGLIPKLIATFRTWHKQATCPHGPWLKDRYPMLASKRGVRCDVPSAHCKKCWKTMPQADVMCRDETRDEYIERATKAGRISREEAGVWFDLSKESEL